MSEWTFIWLAYGTTWVVLTGYTVFGVTRLRRAERRRAAAESHNGGGI